MAITTRIKIVLLIILQTVHCAIEPYKWMYFQPYGSTVYLEPLYNNTQCNIQTQCYWLLPDGRSRLNYQLNGNVTAKYLIRSDGILRIVDIQASDNGIYHYFQMNNGSWIVSKALLNLHGAPFPSLWLEYWPNVLGGLVAMAVVFITFGLIMLADKYRYRPPSTLTTHSLSKRPGTIEPVVIDRANPVFVTDDNVTMSSQKRTLSQRSSSNSNATELRVERL